MYQNNDKYTVLFIVLAPFLLILFLILTSKSEVCVKMDRVTEFVQAVGHNSYTSYIYQTGSGIIKSSTLVNIGEDICVKYEKSSPMYKVIYDSKFKPKTTN